MYPTLPGFQNTHLAISFILFILLTRAEFEYLAEENVIHKDSAMFHFRLKPLRAALLLVLGGSAQAATITVNSNADPGVPNDDLCTLCE